MAQQFHNLEFSTLIELLAVYTTDYYKMESEELEPDKLKKYRDIIDELQLEIESRKKVQENTTVTDPAFNFKNDPAS